MPISDEDRARAGSFGADAERYDRARPRYPDQLFDDLIGGRAVSVLDVGCGTGIVAAALQARHCRVLGVEPDPRMAAVARRKGIGVDVASFEDWPPGGRRFDLVISGQAWHWVDPDVGTAKAASVLKAGGRLALAWNHGEHDAVTQAALDEAYARCAPRLLGASMTLGRPAEPADGYGHDIRASGKFAEPEVRTYRWRRRYTTQEWIDLLPTHSDHRLLPPDSLAALLAAAAASIDELGGELTLDYETVLITAVRSARP